MNSVIVTFSQTSHDIDHCSDTKDQAIPFTMSTNRQYVFCQNKRGISLKFIPPKDHAEYYPNIHSAPFNTASAHFCIATYEDISSMHMFPTNLL